MEPLEEAIMEYLYDNKDREVSVYDLQTALGQPIPVLRSSADKLREAGYIDSIEFDGTTKITTRGIRKMEKSAR